MDDKMDHKNGRKIHMMNTTVGLDKRQFDAVVAVGSSDLSGHQSL